MLNHFSQQLSKIYCRSKSRIKFQMWGWVSSHACSQSVWTKRKGWMGFPFPLATTLTLCMLHLKRLKWKQGLSDEICQHQKNQPKDGKHDIIYRYLWIWEKILSLSLFSILKSLSLASKLFIFLWGGILYPSLNNLEFAFVADFKPYSPSYLLHAIHPLIPNIVLINKKQKHYIKI